MREAGRDTTQDQLDKSKSAHVREELPLPEARHH